MTGERAVLEATVAYGKALDKVMLFMIRRLMGLFNTGTRGEDMVRQATPVVRRAMMEAWALGVTLLDAHARATVGGLSYVPRPPWFTPRQMRRILARNGGGEHDRMASVIREVEWVARNTARNTLRRAAVEDLPDGKRRKHASSPLLQPSGDGRDIRRDAKTITTGHTATRDKDADWVSSLVEDVSKLRRTGAKVVMEGGDWDPGTQYDYKRLRDQQTSREEDKHGEIGAARPFAWARVIQGEYTCPFCIMLASRGPIYKSEKTAGYSWNKRRLGLVDDSYHFNCDCLVVPVYTSKNWAGKKQHEYLKQLWKTHGAKDVYDFGKNLRELDEAGRLDYSSMSIVKEHETITQEVKP